MCLLSSLLCGNIRQTREPPGKLSLSLSMTNSWHQGAGQGHQHRNARKSERIRHASDALPATLTMTWSRTPDGR